jgi:cytochrome c-type biogenesis protein CcmE
VRARRGRLVLGVAVVAGALGWVAFRGLSGNLVYYLTPSEILHKGTSEVGQRVRMGGLVEPGSVRQDGTVVRFVVTDGTTHMTVVDTAGVPSLFAPGKGVVVEGAYGADGAFHADTVLVKHSDNYRPPAPGQTPTAANLQGNG